MPPSTLLRILEASIAFLLSAMLLISCGLLTEPQPEMNEAARPVIMKQSAPTNLVEGDALCGGIFLRLFPEDDSLAITSVELYMEGTAITGRTPNPYEFFFDTRDFRSGQHSFVFVVHGPERGGQLLNLLGYPSKLYSTSFVFNQAPLPPAPKNPWLHWFYHAHPSITWGNPSSDDLLVDHITIERIYPTRFSTTIPKGSRSFDDTSIVCNATGMVYMIGMTNQSGTNYSRCSY